MTQEPSAHPPPAKGTLLRLMIACVTSLLIYALVFGFIIDRPLSLGFLQRQIDMKLARASTVRTPKLVILGGSNGPYSHRCEVIESILAMPCINGGVAVGIGLDYLFARWKPELHAGDLVYLPMEETQYVRTRAAIDMGPDAAIMYRHDWQTLAERQPERWLAALFSFDLRAAMMGPIEVTLVAAHFHDPRPEATGATNAWGDHVGHTEQLAASNQATLAAATPQHASAELVSAGYGSALIADFVRWATAHGVHVIGGLPTQFADAPMSYATIEAIRTIFIANGGIFLELPNLSRYPRAAFFDSPDHLNETWQVRHSQLLGAQLQLLREPNSAVRQAHPAAPQAADSTPTD